MCGLVAIYKTSDAELNPAVVEAMTSSLEHRGLEDFGYAFVGPDTSFTWRTERPNTIRAKGVAMGHRRMAIFDLSTKGRQPFITPDDRYWMVFNGEIYNFIEIRAELIELGHVFNTDSDTEVLLASFAEWGTECFKRFLGVWAVVIWDKQERRLVVCRDRLGVKPLYHCKVNGEWLFASEAKALFKHPGVSPKPNKAMVFDHLSRNFFPSGADTLYDSISSLEPGTILSIQDGKIESWRHWTMPLNGAPVITDRDEAVERFLFLLKDSVKLCLRADIRVGTTLSGGLDSTSIITTVNEILESDGGARDTVGDDLQAFSAIFPGERIDESEKIDELCGYLNLTGHKIYPMEATDIEQVAQDVIYAMEMPFNSSIPIVNYLLLRRARAEGAPIVLNGYGPDETLAGFPASHCPIAAADELRALRLGRCLEEIRGMVKHQGRSWKWALGVTLERVLPFSILPKNPNVGQEALDSLFRQDWLQGRETRSFYQEYRRTQGRTELDKELRWEFFEGLVPRWMQMEDRVSMAASAVTRQPFLDHRMIEFAFSLDNSLKVRDAHTKYIIRESMKDKLPKSVVSDSRKYYFPGPNVHWLNGALKPLLQSVLGQGEPMVSEFIERQALTKLLSDFFGGDHGKLRLIWRLFNTELWMRAYFR